MEIDWIATVYDIKYINFQGALEIYRFNTLQDAIRSLLWGNSSVNNTNDNITLNNITISSLCSDVESVIWIGSNFPMTMSD